MKDTATERYFDEYIPEYHAVRFRRIVDVINSRCQPGASLVDVGCGTGNILHYIKENTSVDKFSGIDVSKNCLTRVNERMICETMLGSVLDGALVESLEGKYDFAIMGALLHHLVGKNRKQSRNYARQSLSNAISLLKRGGCLFISEPVFSPSSAMSTLFYIKKFVTRFTSKRVGLFSKWANLGMPVVSFYTWKELLELSLDIPQTNIIVQELTDLGRRFCILRRGEAVLIIEKT